MDQLSLWLSIPGIIGLIATVIKIIFDQKKDKATVADTIQEAAGGLVDMLVLDVKRTRKELSLAKLHIVELEIRLDAANNRITRLENQLKGIGRVPVNGASKTRG
jgi:hypothetical protein